MLGLGSFTFATFNFAVSGLVLLPSVGSVPAAWGFIWPNNFSLIIFPSWLCFSLFVLSWVAVLLACLIILISATCGHFYLTCVSLTPPFCSFSHIFGTYLSSSALFGTLPGPRPPRLQTVSLKPENCGALRSTPLSNLFSCFSLMSQSPICTFVSPLFTESINTDHISDCWIFKWTLSMRSPSQTN